MQNVVCEKCGETVRFCKDDEVDTIKCCFCGGTYRIDTNTISGHSIERTYNFVEFQCVYATYSDKCNNECPAPKMYCKEHTTDNSFISAEGSVSHAKGRLQTAEDTLEQMKESKKIWLIQEVSGINEQDNFIRED